MSIQTTLCPHCGTEGFHMSCAYRATADVKQAADDLVNHPPHYTQGGIECIEAIEAMTSNPAWGPPTAYRLGNVLKYIWRHADKDPVGSLKKARWYLDREIERAEANA